MSVKNEFIVSELWILSWGASVQRANLFLPGASEIERQKFRKEVILFLEDTILENYKTPVSENDHESNIVSLSEKGSQLGIGILGSNGYKIGIAQKLLNLQLKYLWCLGAIEEPPHCPVDRVMIKRTRFKDKVAWTKITEIEEYRRVILAMKDEAAALGLTLAQWELNLYNRNDANKSMQSN